MIPVKYQLIDRNMTPPGGFIYRHSTGETISGFCKEAIVQQVRIQMPGEVPDNLSELIDQHTVENLKKNGHHQFFFEILPSIKEQGFGTITDIDNHDLLPPGKYYYNPSIIHWKGKDWLVYRRQLGIGGVPDPSDIVVCQLKNDKPVKGTHKKINIPERYPQEQFEDPRIFEHNGDLYISYCSWRGNWKYAPMQCLIELDDDFNFVRDIPIEFGKNGTVLMEKNWGFFSLDGEMLFSYTVCPHVVAQIYDLQGASYTKQLCKEPWESNWHYGELRGGSPPVFVDNLLYSFFHSSYIDSASGKRRYVIGCFAFESFWPFRVISATPDPLLMASDKDPFLPWAPLVVFCAGAIYNPDTESWKCALGINDSYSAILSFTHAELLERMQPV